MLLSQGLLQKTSFACSMLVGGLCHAVEHHEAALEIKQHSLQQDPSNTAPQTAVVDNPSRGSVSVDLGRFIIAYGTVSLRYDGAVRSWLDITVPLSVTSKSMSIWSNLTDANSASIFPFFGLSAGLGAKFHGTHWYVEPFMRAGYAWLFSSLFKPFDLIGTPFIEPGTGVGVQWHFPSGFLFDAGIEVAMRKHIYETLEAQDKPFVDPLFPKLGGRLSLGYWW